MTLIAAAADPLNEGAALAGLLDATLQQDLAEQGEALAQVEHLILVNAKLASVAGMFASVYAQQHGEALEQTLQRLALTSLIADPT